MALYRGRGRGGWHRPFSRGPVGAGAQIPTVEELEEETDELERLIARRRAFIEKWRAEGVDASEEAACLSFEWMCANEQIYRVLQVRAPSDGVIERRGETPDELVAAAYGRVNAYSRLIGVSAEARAVAYELSQKADAEAAGGLEKLFALIEETREAPIRIRQEGGATHEA